MINVAGVMAKIEDDGMEHLAFIDKVAPDGPAKDLTAFLAWEELLLDWDDDNMVIVAESKIRKFLESRK